MSNTDWIDARVNKPGTDFTGKSDIVFCLCTNGVVRVALWDSNSGFWYDPETAETFGNVQYFLDFSLPHGYKLADFYYKED